MSIPLKFKKTLDYLQQAEKIDKKTIHLTANESVMSSLATKWQTSILSTRYILGDLNERDKKESYFFKDSFLIQGIPALDELEFLVKNSCKKMFHCQESNFAPLSGLHAMISLISTITNPNDLIMTLPPNYGGHYATVPLLKNIGRKQIFLPYLPNGLEIDLKQLKQLTSKNKVKMIYLDAMHFFNPFPLKKIKEIMPKAILIYDASHVLGLIAGKQFQSPLLEGADILSGNTHKTIPGPQKAMILYKDKSLFNKSSMIADIFTSSRHTGSTISLFITLLEMEQFGKEYASQIIRNSQILADVLYKNGFEIMAYPEIKPQTHQLLIKVNNIKEGLKLIKAGMSINTVSLFNSQFIRLGTQQITRLGMKEQEMEHLANLITKALKENSINKTRKEVEKLANKFNKVHYCF